MVIAVTLNPTLDRTLEVASLEPGGVHEVERSVSVAGGKGVNVARVCQALGGRSLASGLLAGETGRLLARRLEEEGIEGRWIWTGGETRSNVTVVDRRSGKDMHFIETGPEVAPGELEELEAVLSQATREGDWVVFSGRPARGLPDSCYGRLIALVRSRGARVALDSSGPALLCGVEARPDILKPNAAELEEIAGKKLRGRDEVLEAVTALAGSGIGTVAASRGVEGVLAATSDGVWEAVPPSMEMIYSVGSGDAFLAGLVHGLGARRGLEEALRLGVACGCANALVPGAGMLCLEDVSRLEPLVTVRKLR